MSAKKVSFGSKPKRETTNAEIDKWVEQRNTSENDGKVKRLTIDISEELHRRLKVTAAQQGVKMNDLVRDWIRKGIQELEA